MLGTNVKSFLLVFSARGITIGLKPMVIPFKELENQYNNLTNDLFGLAVQYLCNLEVK